MVLKLYFDLLSQPARSLYIFLKLTKIPFEECRVSLGKGEHLTQEFAETKSKIQKIPFIHHGDFRLNESIGIVRYLSREYHNIADHWYPKDSKKQAKVDEFLEWHHLNIRLNCSTYFLVKWLMPFKNGKQPSEAETKNLTKRMEKSLKDFERIFLSNERFIFGNSISYADVHAACEIEQTRMAGYDVRDHFPKLKTWIENVRSECNPVYDQAHESVNMIAEGNETVLNSKL